jgi:hypothetical protein
MVDGQLSAVGMSDSSRLASIFECRLLSVYTYTYIYTCIVLYLCSLIYVYTYKMQGIETFKPMPFGQPVRLSQWGLAPAVAHSPVVYPASADNDSRPLASRLKSVNQPVISTRNPFLTLRPRLLAHI